MNSPSPLIPQGSSLEQQNQARSSLKVKIFCAIGVNVAVLLVLLMQGCKREQPPVETVQTETAPVYDESNQPPVVTDPVTGAVVGAPGTNSVAEVYEQPPVTPVTPVVTTPVVATPTATEYKIESGDSFYSIGKKFGVSTKAIQTANPTVDPKKLQVGKTIQIPAPATDAAVAAAPVVDVGTGETLYTVKSGDTLGKIAIQFRTTVPAIQSANGLADTRIKVGQKLKIPAKTTTP